MDANMKLQLLSNQHAVDANSDGSEEESLTDGARSKNDNYLKIHKSIKEMRRGSAEIMKSAICGLERRRASEQYIKIPHLPSYDQHKGINNLKRNCPVMRNETLKPLANVQQEGCKHIEYIQRPVKHAGTANNGWNSEDEFCAPECNKVNAIIETGQMVEKQNNKLLIPMIAIQTQWDEGEKEDDNEEEDKEEKEEGEEEEQERDENAFGNLSVTSEQEKTIDDMSFAELPAQNLKLASEHCIKLITAEAEGRPSNDALLKAVAQEGRRGSVLLLKQLIEQEAHENNLDDNKRLPDLTENRQRQDSMALRRQLLSKPFTGSKSSLSSLKSVHSIQLHGLTAPSSRSSIQLQQPCNSVTYITICQVT